MADDATQTAEAPANAPTAKTAKVASVSPKKREQQGRRRRPKLISANADNDAVSAAADAEREKIVHIVQRFQEESKTPQTLGERPYLLISVLVVVALPTLIAAFFYIFIAADRFVSEARFAVRSNEAPAFDALGMLTGMPSSQIVSDSYIVVDYITSRDMMVELERRLPIREIFSRDEADFVYTLDADLSLDSLVEYWKGRVTTFYDSTKNTIVVAVDAFRAEDAEKVVGEVVAIVRNLVNDLSAQARRDAVQFAASEVARAELRVRDARQQILEFRIANKQLDPTQSASATLSIAAQLEAERSKLSSQLASLMSYLSDEAPSVQVLKARIAALDGEIANINSLVATPAANSGSSSTGIGSEVGEAMAQSGAMATVVGQYQELLINQEFAEKAYAASLASLERARSEAARTQSYLAIYGQPSSAQEATYPRRYLNILIVFIMSLVAWAIGALGFLAVRDHVT